MPVVLHKGNNEEKSSLNIKSIKLISDKQLPISEAAIFSKEPLGFELEIDGLKEGLKFSVEQLTMDEFQYLFGYLTVIKNILEKSDSSLINKNQMLFIQQFPFYLSHLIKCDNIELLVGSTLAYISRLEDKEQIRDKDLYFLLKECLKSDEKFLPKELEEIIKLKKFRLYILYLKEKKYFRNIYRILINAIVSQAIYNIVKKFQLDKIIWLCEKVVWYNEGCRKEKDFPIIPKKKTDLNS